MFVQRALLVPVTIALAFAGCRCQEDEEAVVTSTPPGVTHCLESIQQAVGAKTLSESTAIYYDGCADLFSVAACRDGWHRAAKDPNVDDRLSVAAMACRPAYCPTFSAFGFNICKEDFVASKDSVLHEWPPLFDAIVAREAGAAAADLSPAFLGFIVHLADLAAKEQKEQKEAPAASGAPSGSAAPSAAPPGSAAPGASATPPAPSGSPAREIPTKTGP
ncbi:MAG TPA: hypothetical protein VHE30_19355 [Polyangiaceae bacterium]|nr:hypothetical protein [Polyangiaceae bacterium]